MKWTDGYSRSIEKAKAESEKILKKILRDQTYFLAADIEGRIRDLEIRVERLADLEHKIYNKLGGREWLLGRVLEEDQGEKEGREQGLEG